MPIYYRLGSGTPKNLTPRPEIDTEGPGHGLSVQNIQPAPAIRFRSIDSALLDTTQVLPTPTEHNPNHYSILTQPDTPLSLDSWAATRALIADNQNNWQNPLVSQWSHDVNDGVVIPDPAEERQQSMHTRSGSNHSHADASAFLPKHKADTAAVEKLVSLSREALIPYYPVMIEWLKDFNWPVARIIAPHLATLGTLLKDDVINVLKGDDVIWKYWVVNQLVNTPDLQLAASIRSELAAQYKTLSSSLDEDDANLALEIEDVLDKLS